MGMWLVIRRIPSWVFPLALGVLLIFLPMLGLDYGTTRNLQLACILALVVSGLNLSLGYAGELAMGQAAMYAAGAYVAGLMSVHGHTDLFLQIIVASAVALVVGVVTGIPALRLGSWSLAMTSFFLVLLIPDVLSIFSVQTGGQNGLTGMVPATLFGGTISTEAFYIVVVVVMIAWFAVFRNLVVSRHGVAFRTLKQSPILASAQGISVYRMKLTAFAIGAIPAGLAGALFANLDLYISPLSFSFTIAMTVLAASILGGSASVYGAFAGALIMQFGPNQSTEFQDYALIFYGIFLIVGGVLLSGGLAKYAKLGIAKLDRMAGWAPPTPTARPGDALPEQAIAGEKLVVSGLEKSFGGNKALNGVELTALPGQITALIGPNGSGKTTLMNMIGGFYRSDAGVIRLGDGELQTLTSDAVARRGVARTFQTPNIPEEITVLEAVQTGRYTTDRVSMLASILRLPKYWKVKHEDHFEAMRVLELVGLAEQAHEKASDLPLGNRRLLELARAVVARPGLLLLDEIASGLDEHEIVRLAELVRQIRAAGSTVVLVEHNFDLVLKLSDVIYVLAQGQVIAEGTPDEIETNPRVLTEYLGISVEEVSS
ncbi:branched-chain amino acid ABC transporter ATP-binding protein/permease [Tomitella biformata]|uniref:branched-chain amino acid ABC transporter ATP-binding protein/permease n=1 Tax=Tomitella biformata TaxID=630403 RepID=UPI00046325E9|nr:branched-chain amino acid ABC transporter ATP-binding protein/permease [Tomitella biformata]